MKRLAIKFAVIGGTILGSSLLAGFSRAVWVMCQNPPPDAISQGLAASGMTLAWLAGTAAFFVAVFGAAYAVAVARED